MKISPALRDLLAEQAKEREGLQIDHHNELIALREAHVAAVAALNEKEKPVEKPQAPPAAAPPTTHDPRHHHKGKSR